MTATALPRVGRATRVLLADDSDGLRLLVRTWLSTVEDLEVVAEASNGAEAVALTDAHRPDVVVLDVAMPVMDGLEALTELHRRFPTLPVVMLSGFAERDVAEQAERRGAYAFVEKSGDLDPLVDAVRRAAAGPLVPPPRRDPAPVAPERAATGAPAPTPEPAPRTGLLRARWTPTALAVVFAVAVMAWRVTSDDPRAPISFLLALPVLVVAVRHGLVGGLVGAALSSAAYSAWALLSGAGTPLVDHAVRYPVFFATAAVAGLGFDRLRRSALQQRQVADAVVATNRRLAELNGQLTDLNAELERTNADLRHFGYVVGHDLAEPLRSMRAFAELLQSRSADRLDDDGRQFLRFLLDGAERMQALITDLRDYTRTGAAELVLRPVDLEEVLRDVRSALRTTLAERGAVLTSGPLPVVAGDRSMLGLVLQNLVANGVKFNRSAPPHVAVAAERDGDRWRITVSDDGIGIDPRMADRALELFGRLQPRDEYPGTGLGLAIAKRVVERHRGSIAIAPHEGGGTVVTVELPALGSWPA